MPDDAALVSDASGRSWTPGPALGRGTWGRSRLVHDPAGREAVLKEPLTAADFPADSPLPDDLLVGCATAAREQADLLEQGTQPFLPKLEATVELGGGRIGVVLPRYGTTLQRRLEAGLGLGEALRVVHRIALALSEAAAVHGNLRPTNVLFGERGEIWLADMVTTPRPHGARLLEEAGVRAWSPPEGAGGRAPSGRADTWALCQVLYAAAMETPDSSAGRAPRFAAEGAGEGRTAEIQLAEPGLDKLALTVLKDHIHTRLAAEGTNPRFRARVADRMGALLSRGLSAEIDPSPPYRFATARELADRVFEVLALLRPRVVDVGKVLWPGHARDGVFQGGQPVSLSVTVGCTPGVADADDLVCGLQLVNLDDRDGARRPTDDAQITVAVHPSGRLRFQVALPDVPPGRYRLKVAFAVKDSGDEPQVVDGEISVRPPPGYVPPLPEDPPPAALPFQPTSTIVPLDESVPASGTSAPVVPLEPSSMESDADDDHVVHLATSRTYPRPVAPPESDVEEFDISSEAAVAPTPLTRLSERPTEPADHPFLNANPLPPRAAPPVLRAAPDLPEDPFGDDSLPDAVVTPKTTTARPAARVDIDIPITPELPSVAPEDLPSWGSDLSGSPFDRLLALVRKDLFAAIGVCVLLVLALTLMLQTC
jgi:hypothetical protein